MVQFVITLFVAPFVKLIVEFPVVELVLKFEIVSELPPVFSPSIVTKSAPVTLIIPIETVPDTVLAPDGVIVIDAQSPGLIVKVPNSPAISAVTRAVMTLPVCEPPPLSALNTPPVFVNDE